MPRGRPPGSKNKSTIASETRKEEGKPQYKATRMSQSEKRFDFSDLIDQPCFYHSMDKCNKPGEIVTIRMLTSKPYWLCAEHALMYIRAIVKSDLRLTSNKDDISPGVKAESE